MFAHSVIKEKVLLCGISEVIWQIYPGSGEGVDIKLSGRKNKHKKTPSSSLQGHVYQPGPPSLCCLISSPCLSFHCHVISFLSLPHHPSLLQPRSFTFSCPSPSLSASAFWTPPHRSSQLPRYHPSLKKKKNNNNQMIMHSSAFWSKSIQQDEKPKQACLLVVQTRCCRCPLWPLHCDPHQQRQKTQCDPDALAHYITCVNVSRRINSPGLAAAVAGVRKSRWHHQPEQVE